MGWGWNTGSVEESRTIEEAIMSVDQYEAGRLHARVADGTRLNTKCIA